MRFTLAFLLFCLLPTFTFSQGSFFERPKELKEAQKEGETPSPSTENQDTKDSTQKKEDEQDSEKQTNKEAENKDFIAPTTLADRVRIRVDNLILTERQVSIFFALRQLSSFLAPLQSISAVEEEMTLVLGLEAFAKANNLYNLLPTRNEMEKRIEFLNVNTNSKTLGEAVAKIDPEGNLTPNDLRKFFYYQIIREKGFVYALQQDFLNKIFTPREDEILLLYKQVLLSNPKIFKSPTQLFIMNIVAVEPANANEKQLLISRLQTLTQNIMKEKDPKRKEQLFIQGIHKYSSSHLKNTNTIGPLDETLVGQDFPEYKDLFDLEVGGLSSIIDQEGFIRLVFIKEKNMGDLRPSSSPEIRQRIMSIIYDAKGNALFHNFLKENLLNFDVQKMDEVS